MNPIRTAAMIEIVVAKTPKNVDQNTSLWINQGDACLSLIGWNSSSKLPLGLT